MLGNTSVIRAVWVFRFLKSSVKKNILYFQCFIILSVFSLKGTQDKKPKYFMTNSS